MDEQTRINLETEEALGARAQALQENTLWKEILQKLVMDTYETWLHTSIGDTEKREKLWCMAVGIRHLEGTLQSCIDIGNNARQQLFAENTEDEG